MRVPVSCTALGLALVAGAPAAYAQTVITRDVVGRPVATTVMQPATVQTIETTRTVRTVPAARHRIVTTRTVTRRIVPAQPIYDEVVPGTVAAAPQPIYGESQPIYDEVATTPAVVGPRPLYDDVSTPLVASPAGAVAASIPVVPNGEIVASQPYTYRYVYEPDRILVIDPITGIAVQSIAR